MSTPKPKFTLASIIAKFTPVAHKAVADSESYEVQCRTLAELIVDLRSIHTYKGRDATEGTPDKPGRPAVPAGIDWRGLSTAYNADLEKVWNAAMPDDSPLVVNWIARTGKTVADFPLRKNVGYHLELALQRRLGKPTCDKYGIPWGTRQDRAKAAAKARQENRTTTNATGDNEFVVNGSVVPVNVINALKTAAAAIKALEGQSIDFGAFPELFMLLTSVSREASARATALMEVNSLKVAS